MLLPLTNYMPNFSNSGVYIIVNAPINLTISRLINNKLLK